MIVASGTALRHSRVITGGDYHRLVSVSCHRLTHSRPGPVTRNKSHINGYEGRTSPQTTHHCRYYSRIKQHVEVFFVFGGFHLKQDFSLRGLCTMAGDGRASCLPCWWRLMSFSSSSRSIRLILTLLCRSGRLSLSYSSVFLDY